MSESKSVFDETWTQNDHLGSVVFGPMDDDEDGAIGEFISPMYARLAAAAPEMYRLLKNMHNSEYNCICFGCARDLLGRNTHEDDCPVEVVLRKADGDR